MIKTIMFDLDDTIFDHKHCRLCGLKALQKEDSRIARVPLVELEAEHELLLQGNYTKVLDKKLTMTDSMVERTWQLFDRYGVNLSKDEAEQYTEVYKQTYNGNRRTVPGVVSFIESLKESVDVGIVSNGLHSVQTEKLRACRIENLFDFIILSEDVGARKPDKAIFEAAMIRCGSRPDEVLFIGDSWESDVIGAIRSGMKAMWLNRYNIMCPDSRMAYEIHSFDGMDIVLRYIRSFV